VQSQETLSGDFGQQPLATVLAGLAADSRSGVLVIDGGGEVWIDNGSIYLAVTESSNQVGDVLFASGVSTETEIAALLKSPDGDAARELANRYPDSIPTLDRLLHEYNLAALFELIVPSARAFRFDPGSRHPVGATFGEPVAQLLDQAEGRLEIWKKIATRIPNTSMVFRLTGTLPSEEEERVVSADEWRYLAMLNGRASIADVIQSTGESAFRVCSSLYRLLLEGLITEEEASG
jgi:hypothetical protein